MSWIKKILNKIDDPIDNLKHWLWRDRPICGKWRGRIRLPMKNKGYFGFEIAIYKERSKKSD